MYLLCKGFNICLYCNAQIIRLLNAFHLFFKKRCSIVCNVMNTTTLSVRYKMPTLYFSFVGFHFHKSRRSVTHSYQNTAFRSYQKDNFPSQSGKQAATQGTH